MFNASSNLDESSKKYYLSIFLFCGFFYQGFYQSTINAIRMYSLTDIHIPYNSILNYVFLVGPVFGTILQKKFGFRLSFLTSLLVSLCGVLMTFIPKSWKLSQISSLLLSLGSGSFDSCLNTTACLLFGGKYKSLFLSLLHLCFGLGTFYGFPILNRIISLEPSKAMHGYELYLICISCFISYIIFFWSNVDSLCQSEKSQMTFKYSFKSYYVWSIGILLGISSLIESSSVIMYQQQFLEESQPSFETCFKLFFFTYSLSKILISYVSDSIGHLKPILISFISLFVIYSLAIVYPSLRYYCFISSGIFLSVFLPGLYSCISDIFTYDIIIPFGISFTIASLLSYICGRLFNYYSFFYLHGSLSILAYCIIGILITTSFHYPFYSNSDYSLVTSKSFTFNDHSLLPI
ncbi:hypothetical protein WA158_003164 [Blastocystis sp. Blastoise]